MGTDIHGVFQRFDNLSKKWTDIESRYEQDRHYQLFAVLADVRNGFGFAGVPTGEAVKPIAEPRGWPDDFQVDGESHPIAELAFIDPSRRKYHEADETLAVWMGDHSHSWLTGEEMLGWFETAPMVIKTGILEREIYNSWDHKSVPSGYSGGISGRNIIVINDNAVDRDLTPEWTHIRCEWDVSLKSDLAYFFDEIQRLVHEHGQIRFVFGFDS